MHKAPVRRLSVRRPTTPRLSPWPIVAAGVAGLLVTPIAYYFVAGSLYGQRPQWSVGQGDGLVAFFVSLVAAPAAAAYCVLAVAFARRWQERSVYWWLLALAGYVALGYAIHLVFPPG